MPISLPVALLIGGGISAGGAVASSIIGSNAAKDAASQEATAQQKGIDYAEQAQAPFVSAGQNSISKIMQDLQNGTFGPGSVTPFTPPTLEEAQATPGYEFTQQQGDKGVLQASAAAGGAISGGTAKALSQYNTNLANTTYGDIYSRALQAYGAKLSGQQQGFNQLFAPAQLGSGSATSTSQLISQLMSQMGQSQAAGTVGSANAITGGISNVSNDVSSGVLLSQLLKLPIFGGSKNGTMAPPSPPVQQPVATMPSYAPPQGWQGPIFDPYNVPG